MRSYMVLNQFKKSIRTLHLYTPNKLFVDSTKKLIKMDNHLNVRWAINSRSWIPTRDEIIAALSCMQTEEQQRILKYVYLDDAKSTMLGRLMLRKYVHYATSIPYNEIRFGRDDRGKPYMIGPDGSSVNFNISHQGDFVVLAGDTQRKVGIDVMKIEAPANKNIQDFFRLMKSQFSKQEWTSILSHNSERDQVACFYRLWCLKESYVKNIGVGITIPLSEISFCLKTPKLRVGEIVTDTTLYQQDILEKGWLFEETLLDEKHTVAVSLQVDKDNRPLEYKLITFKDLVEGAKALFEPNITMAEDFLKKENKSF